MKLNYYLVHTCFEPVSSESDGLPFVWVNLFAELFSQIFCNRESISWKMTSTGRFPSIWLSKSEYVGRIASEFCLYVSRRDLTWKIKKKLKFRKDIPALSKYYCIKRKKEVKKPYKLSSTVSWDGFKSCHKHVRATMITVFIVKNCPSQMPTASYKIERNAWKSSPDSLKFSD
jgi:hypothetical protein